MSSTDPQPPSSQPPAPPAPTDAPRAFTDADLQSVQGIGVAGFKKDHQELIFFVLPPQPAAKPVAAALVEEIATAQDVGEFNQRFSQYRREHGGKDPDFQATWVGIGLSASGLEKLGADLMQLPGGAGRDAFVAGMAARATQIQDSGASAPANWNPAFRGRGGVDGVLVVAADEPDDLASKVEALTEVLTGAGAQVVFQEHGETLPAPLTGHEHFGFKDGASQPAIVGYDPAPAPGEPAAVNAGEFVLGFPDQTGGATAVPPTWAGGSFLVFRRLRQDVMAFRAFVKTPIAGADPAVSSDLFAAKSVGRWPSGAPLEKYHDADPGPGHEDNDFSFASAGDDDGLVVPTWAHIRKANPRDETQPPPPDGPVRHRMIRRGIPFGAPLSETATADDGQQCGLHFIAIVADVARQFEFVQASWMNNENFPKGSKPAQGGPYAPPAPGTPGDGPDPIVGEGNNNKALQLHQASGVRPIPLTGDLVTVTAGEYFFCPSINGLKLLTA